MKKLFLILIFIPLISFTQKNYVNDVKTDTSSTAIDIEVIIGERLSDLIEKLEERELISKKAVEELINSGVFNDKYDFVPNHVNGLLRLEGLIAPGLYSVYDLKDTKGLNALSEIRDNCMTIFNVLLSASNERFSSKDKIRGLTQYELITMASIVEKEDAFDTHAGIIASAFWNRHANNDRFGSCVTVEYLIGYHRPFLLNKDLDKVSDSPWSTYHRKGLPPTPICFVSDYTIKETINAKETSYYFFVMDWVNKIPYMADSYQKHLSNAKIAKQSVIDVYGSKIIHQKMENYYYDYFSKNLKK